MLLFLAWSVILQATAAVFALSLELYRRLSISNHAEVAIKCKRASPRDQIHDSPTPSSVAENSVRSHKIVQESCMYE